MKKSVVTVNGKDSVGIIAKVCMYMAENNINILDVTQTSENGEFNMTAVIDLEVSRKAQDVVAAELHELGNQIGMDIRCQAEEN